VRASAIGAQQTVDLMGIGLALCALTIFVGIPTVRTIR